MSVYWSLKTLASAFTETLLALHWRSLKLRLHWDRYSLGRWFQWRKNKNQCKSIWECQCFNALQYQCDHRSSKCRCQCHQRFSEHWYSVIPVPVSVSAVPTVPVFSVLTPILHIPIITYQQLHGPSWKTKWQSNRLVHLCYCGENDQQNHQF